MQPFSSEAIVLRRTNYGEADRVVSFLTPVRGKVSVMAKAVRRPKSKLAGGVELFAVCDITCVSGRGELMVLTSARLRTFFGNILKDYERMQLGYECIKQVNRVAETVSEPEFYQLLKATLTALDDLSADWRVVELGFRMHLAALLGHGLNLATDQTGAKLRAEANYGYDANDNAFYEDPSGQFGSAAIKLLRLAAATPDPGALLRLSGTAAVIEQCLGLSRLTTP